MNPYVPMPPRIARMPHDPRGMPLLSIVSRDEDGRGDFARPDLSRKLIVGVLNLCGICGLPLESAPVYVLVAADEDGFNDLYETAEPPVHEICAHFALRVCPFLLDPTAAVRRGELRGTSRGDVRLVGYERVEEVIWDAEVVFKLGARLSVNADVSNTTQRYEELLKAEPPLTLSERERELLARIEEPHHELLLEEAVVIAAWNHPKVHLGAIGRFHRKAAEIANLSDAEIEDRSNGVTLVPLVRAWARERGPTSSGFVAL